MNCPYRFLDGERADFPVEPFEIRMSERRSA